MYSYQTPYVKVGVDLVCFHLVDSRRTGRNLPDQTRCIPMQFHLGVLALTVIQRTYGLVPMHYRTKFRRSTFVFMTAYATAIENDRKPSMLKYSLEAESQNSSPLMQKPTFGNDADPHLSLANLHRFTKSPFFILFPFFYVSVL